MKLKIAVMFGGRSMEHDVSVLTALLALRAVNRARYDVEAVYLNDGFFYMSKVNKLCDFTPFEPAKHKKCVLQSGTFFEIKKNKLYKVFKPDVALLCFHGGEGENGVLQALLQFNGIPYTSSGVDGSAIGMNKRLSKEFFAALRLNVLSSERTSKNEYDEDESKVLTSIENAVGYPVIVKPESLGSSIGIGSAHNRDELASALETAFEYDLRAVVEPLLQDFTEVNCAAVKDGNEVILSQTEEPLRWSDFLTFDEKYIGGTKGGGHVIPADIGALADDVRQATGKVYRELGLRGVVRMDFLVDKARGKVYLNEINTIPGSFAHYLFEPLGITFERLIDIMIASATSDFAERRKSNGSAPNVLGAYRGTKTLRK